MGIAQGKANQWEFSMFIAFYFGSFPLHSKPTGAQLKQAEISAFLWGLLVSAPNTTNPWKTLFTIF